MLQADRRIDLGAAQDIATQQSSNRSSSGSVGISYGTSGLMFNASAAAGSGRADGDDVVQRDTVVPGGRQVTLSSGGDTTLRGAVVAADKVKADVGGDLLIESLQDTSTFTSRQADAAASVSIGYGQSSGSLNAAKTNVDSTFRSVGRQSGIRTGDGGFEVDVSGVATLKGGVIASTDKAVADHANRFGSAKVITSDIANEARYSAQSVGVNVSGGSQSGRSGSSGLTGSGMGVGRESGSAASTTVAGISGIAGDTRVRSTDAETGLAPVFDAGRVQASVAAQAQLTQPFSRQAPKAVAEFAAGQAASLDAQARAEPDPARRADLQAEAARWQEGGVYRAALHTAAGALGGGVAGAGGAAVSAAAAPLLDRLQLGATDALAKAGLDPSAARLAAQSLASLTAAGAGAVAGGVMGAAGGLAVDANNRQLHPVEAQRIKELAKGDPRVERRLMQAACALVHCADGIPPSDPAYANLKAIQDADASLTAEQALLSQQKGLDGRNFQPLFQYTTGQAFGDLLDQTQAGTRALGAAQAGIGLAGTVGGQAACITGVGCVVTAATRTVSADNLQAGVRTAISGSPTPTQGELVLQSLGVDPRTAEAVYGLAGMALGSGVAVKAADAVATTVAGKAMQAQGALETQALLDARGVIDPRTGTSLLDLKPFTNAQKGMVGEYLGEQTVRGIVPDGVKISRSQAVGQNGIDDLYKVSRPDLDYLMIEYKVVGDWDKAGTSALKNTKDGLQASESWFLGGNRLATSVGRDVARDVRESIQANRTETWVVTIRTDGSSEIQVLDSFGRAKAVDTSKFVLPARP
jgi:filamentous hemagglutinin